jgi:lipopolysaccharide transport protein LptA
MPTCTPYLGARGTLVAGATLAALTLLSVLFHLSAARGAVPPGADADNREKCREPVCLNGARLEADSTHLTLHDFDIEYVTRGTTVKGDLAVGESSSRDSKNTSWVLTGHVQIFMPQGHLSADRATMQVVNGRIASVTASGSPAEFERAADAPAPTGSNSQVLAAAEHAHGHAHEIIYDLDRNELQLNGDSYISNGCYEFSSERMSYDVGNQRVEADPRDSGGVRGKYIRERTSSACGPGPDKP